MKIAEQITGQVIIPSVMELRYAGRRIADAFRAQDAGQPPSVVAKYLADAEFDCIRAQHDSADVAINFMAIFLDELFKNIEPFSLAEADVQLLTKFLDRISSFRSRIALSRANRSSRKEIYESLIQELDGITAEFFELKALSLRIMVRSDDYHRLGKTPTYVATEAVRARRTQSLMQVAIVTAALVSGVFSAILALM